MSLGRAAGANTRRAFSARTAFVLAFVVSTSSSAALAQAAPQSGGTLVVALARQDECLDPQQSNYGYGSNDGRQLVDSLTEQSYANPTEIVPWLATSWDINKDATRYTFRLRPDVTFSDGSKLDATLVKNNFEKLAKIPGAAGGAYLKGITDIKVLDPLTIEISFDQPNVPFLQATSTAELGLLAQTTLDKTANERCSGGVIGSGPFVLEKVVYNQEAVLAKRADYNWPSKLRTHGGPAYLDKVVYKIVPEASVRTGALKSQQVDVIQNVSDQDAATLEKGGYPVTGVNSLGMAVNLVINVSRPILADRAVRLALRQGINRQEVSEIAFSGHQPAATGLLTPQAPNHLDQSKDLAYDPDLARKRLEEDGWKEGADGIRVKDGQPLVITASYRAGAINQAFLEVVQQQARDIGIDLKLRPLTAGGFDEALLAGNYDLHRWTWYLADADVLRGVYSTKTLNRFRLPADNKIDALLDKQRATTDVAERRKLTDEVQKIILDEAYAIPVFNAVALWAQSPRARNVLYGPGGSGGPNQIFYEAWLAD
ncbi:ABC transporter substrate-binding protein [Ancylobacter sp. Lp-2]|uniref:ABC transporter substrate-binding protein n=1 Tax=Ancylobacter sp. Lp-2 TaxID=2881339 RepID=UPI001E552534|nr:ABC transporter substrate-binding protein [Ancylobacter sp. Lp-2]MCB4770440.1 ABC transporter substrate-binding protein [Ancylobacter sp. Lp-2]